jgi:hypothetical protein
MGYVGMVNLCRAQIICTIPQAQPIKRELGAHELSMALIRDDGSGTRGRQARDLGGTKWEQANKSWKKKTFSRLVL